MARAAVSLVAAAAALAAVCDAAVPVTNANMLFGHAIKNGPLPPNTELTTFEHNCTVAPCTVTQVRDAATPRAYS